MEILGKNYGVIFFQRNRFCDLDARVFLEMDEPISKYRDRQGFDTRRDQAFLDGQIYGEHEKTV